MSIFLKEETVNIVTIRPQDDSAARIVGTWLKEFENKYDVEYGRISTREELEQIFYLSRKNSIKIKLIVFYGHGTRCSLSSKGMQGYEEIVDFDDTRRTHTPGDKCDRHLGCKQCLQLPVKDAFLDIGNISSFSDTIIYTVACHSLLKLGKEHGAIGSPGSAYFGYSTMICVPPDESISNKIKQVVNGGLELLCNQSQLHNREECFQEVVKYIKKSFFELPDVDNNSLLSCITPCEMFAAMWRSAFDGQWATKAG